jgi:hypothetical protein
MWHRHLWRISSGMAKMSMAYNGENKRKLIESGEMYQQLESEEILKYRRNVSKIMAAMENKEWQCGNWKKKSIEKRRRISAAKIAQCSSRGGA